MPGDLSLLYPEWQSYGVDAAVHRGAIAIATDLFDASGFVCVEAPLEEVLTSQDGVLGLGSIAPRARRTLDDLRRRAPDRIFMVGGTCGADVAPVTYVNERYGGDLAVVWLDAHGDLNTPESSPSGHFHGMVLRTLIGHGPASMVSAMRLPLRPSQVFLAGTRDLDPPEAQFVTSAGVSVTTCAELETSQVLGERIRDAGFTRVYVHLDLDVLDPDSFQHSLMQAPGGVSPELVARTVRHLATSVEVVGFSLVEYQERSEGGLAQVRQLLERTGLDIGALGRLRQD